MQCLGLWFTTQCLSMLLISEVSYWPKLFVNFVMQTLQYCSNWTIYFFTQTPLRATTDDYFHYWYCASFPWFICIAKTHDIKPNSLTLIALHFHLPSDITLTSGAKSKQTVVSAGQLSRANKCNSMDPGNDRECNFLPAPAGCSMSSLPWMGLKGYILKGTISNKTGSSISTMGR